MRRFGLLLCWICVTLIGHGFGTDRSPLLDTLNKTYGGKSAMLRRFYCNSRLEYDSDGRVIGSPKPGAWTACGFVALKEFRVKGDVLELRGDRTGITFNNGKFVSVKGDGVKIEIRLTPDATAETVERAMDAVFFDKQTKLIDAVPDYWRCYLQHPTMKPGELKCDPPPEQKRQVFRVGKGVSAPKPISDRDPDYTNVARAAHHQGTVVMAVEVNESGQIENVNITRPLGLGLDDAAVEAVRGWKFEPSRQGSDPVRVQITIEVNFHMGMKLKSMSDY